MDPTQILLFAVVVILTFLLLIVGIQVFFILRETKKAIKKTNKLLEEAQEVLPTFKKPILAAGNMFETFKNVKHVIDFLSREGVGLLSRRRGIKDTIEDVADELNIPTRPRRPSIYARTKRVFRKGGKPLAS